jgi:hypothetical protein
MLLLIQCGKYEKQRELDPCKINVSAFSWWDSGKL